MKCKGIIQKFLEADDFNSLPVTIQLHMLFCRKCRIEISVLTGVFNSFRGGSPFPMERDLSGAIMKKILRRNIQGDFSIPVFHWIAVWFIIMAGIFLLPFNEQFIWLIKYFGMKLIVPITIVMGLLISIYSTFYIGTHLKDFKRFHEFIKKLLKNYQ